MNTCLCRFFFFVHTYRRIFYNLHLAYEVVCTLLLELAKTLGILCNISDTFMVN